MGELDVGEFLRRWDDLRMRLHALVTRLGVEAVRRRFLDRSGGIGAIGYSAFQGKLSGMNRPSDPSLEAGEFLALVIQLGTPEARAILRDYVAIAGFDLVAKGGAAAGGADLAALALRAGAEVGDLHRAVAAATADGRVTPLERERIVREARDGVEALHAVERAAEGAS